MIQVRPSVYRRKSGYTISGLNPRGQRISIFTETRASANHIAAKVRRGEDVTLPDFTYPDNPTTIQED